MAKKKTVARRVPRTAETRMYGDGRPSAVSQQSNPARPGGVAARVGGMANRAAVSLSQEYKYVPADLRRLGILAASIFVLLIVLGLVIR